MKAHYKKHILEFKTPSGTSRGILKTKEAWFIVLENNGEFGVGECGMLRGLSIDDRPDFEQTLQWVCANIHLGEQHLYDALTEFPSIQMGLEIAFKSLAAPDPFQIYPSAFTKGEASIAINGLIWMGDKAFMSKQITTKLNEGFGCIKMKIGAIDFETELSLLKSIRKDFSSKEIDIMITKYAAITSEKKILLTTEKDYMRLSGKISFLSYLEMSTNFMECDSQFIDSVKLFLNETNLSAKGLE